MRLFDLHCDTLTECVEKRETLRTATGDVSLAKAAGYDPWAQVFAVFVPDTLAGQAAADRRDQLLDFYDSQREELARHCRPILSLENGSALMGDPRQLEPLAARGVRAVTITWNGENELGYGAQCDPAKGLKPFGKEVVRRCFALGVFPDISHLNPAGFRDVAELSARAGKPLLATHSCCAALQPHCRNLGDAQLRAIFESGGLLGLCLYKEFLGGEGGPADFARHLAHIIALGGAENVALGSDFDGCELHPALAGLDKMAGLNEALEALGFAEETREALFWGNAARFFGM